jgi:cytosine/adenosine deaminase-related metal-dependent hydrolase
MQGPVDMLITHGYVVTMNPTRQVHRDGAIAITGKRITAVGSTAEILARYQSNHVIHADGMMVLPGLIDGHNHPTSYLATGLTDDLDVRTSVFKRLYPYESALRPEEAHIAALGSFVEMIKNGTTCFNDPGGYDVDYVGDAARIVGIRGILTRSLRDFTDPDMVAATALVEDVETCLREGEGILTRWNGAENGRIRAWLSLRNVVCVSDELCKQVRDLAKEWKVGIHTHVASVKGGNEVTMRLFGKRALTRYYELGLFGPNLYCAHVGFPDDAEVTLLKQHDVKVAHCPAASQLAAMGVIANGMIPKMMRKGVTVSLGSDTAGAAGFLDLIRTMYVAACAHRDAHFDPQIMDATKALEMATIDGARACLWDDEIGSLEPNKLADIVLIDRKGLGWAHPARDPIRSLVYSGTGDSVDTAIIDGRVVMRKRVILTVDEEDVMRRVSEAEMAVMRRSGFGTELRWPGM